MPKLDYRRDPDEIYSITLLFENCESMFFNRNVIGDLYIGDISTSIRRIASNSITKMHKIEEVYIELFSEGDETYDPFGQRDWETTKFARILKYNDITGITVEYGDGKTETYYTLYEESDEHRDLLGAENIHQKTYLSDFGNLYLVISKERNVSDFVDIDDVNDGESVAWRKEAFSIGVEEEPWHEIMTDDMPEFFRYLYIENNDGEIGTAVYVPARNGFPERFVFKSEDQALHDLKNWMYVPGDFAKLTDRLCSSGKNDRYPESFSIDNLRRTYEN